MRSCLTCGVVGFIVLALVVIIVPPLERWKAWNDYQSYPTLDSEIELVKWYPDREAEADRILSVKLVGQNNPRELKRYLTLLPEGKHRDDIRQALWTDFGPQGGRYRIVAAQGEPIGVYVDLSGHGGGRVVADAAPGLLLKALGKVGLRGRQAYSTKGAGVILRGTVGEGDRYALVHTLREAPVREAPDGALTASGYEVSALLELQSGEEILWSIPVRAGTRGTSSKSAGLQSALVQSAVDELGAQLDKALDPTR